jgi:putative ATPase
MSDDLSLFGEPGTSGRAGARDGAPSAPPKPAADAPLAERMRPRTLDEIVGQQKLVGPEGTLRKLTDSGALPNLILYGPPGSGKTTLARVLAAQSGASFVPFNAVSEGVPRLREVVKEAEARRKAGRGTLLFIDEIHRLNKGQQDFLLPWIESGLMTLIGATTEHPGFEVNPAVLSRSTVLVLEPLSEEDVRAVVRRAVADEERGFGGRVTLESEAEDVLAQRTGGDARQALTGLEIAARLVGGQGVVTAEAAREALQQRAARYDTTLGFEMLSAFHKSLRSSAGSAALYWAQRMIQAGEEPRVVFRRLIAAAYEDVGLADPQAGIVSVQAMLAYERMGPPEGFLPLYNAILYVANAPKSNRAYLAGGAAAEAARQHPDLPVPLHLRNAPTSLMKEWGYGEGYQYAHDHEGGYTPQQCLPDDIAGMRFYDPTDRGYEAKIRQRMKERGDPG